MGPDDQSLDMRFDQSNDEISTAKDLLNNATEYELGMIFKRFGDEKYSSQLAKKFMDFRRGRVISTTGDLK